MMSQQAISSALTTPAIDTSGRAVKPRPYARRKKRSMPKGSSPMSSASATSSSIASTTAGLNVAP